MNQSTEDQAECPLCMEPFEVDDLNFFPCTCGYQICRFCWHRIRTDENGLCPACRKAYPENPADFKPLSQEQVAKLKAEKRQKEQQRKQKATESRKHLANVRVVQKNLVFVVGLPIRLADANVLKKHEYFGKFGKIHKVVINQSTSYAGAMGPSASAYVTYNKCEDALRAIQSVNNICVDNRILKTSLGTTKYCSHFIKTQTCPKPDCMYLHDLGDPEASFTKEEMQQGKHQEYEKKLHEQLNNSLSRDRKATPSPPTLGTSTSSFPSVKEAWPSLQLGTTTSSTNGTTSVTVISTITDTTTTNTTSSSSTTTSNSSSTSPESSHTTQAATTTTITTNNNNNKQNTKSKEKNKEKTVEKSTNGKRKGKEKVHNINNNNNTSTTTNNNSNNNNSRTCSTSCSEDSNKEKRSNEQTLSTSQSDNCINSRIITSTNHRSSLFEPDNNSFFSTNSFTKINSNGSKDSVPPNGFIKLPESIRNSFQGSLKNHIGKDETASESETLGNKENQLRNSLEKLNDQETVLTNGYVTDISSTSYEPYNYQQKEFPYQNGVGYQNNQNLFNNFLSSGNSQKVKNDPDVFITQNIFGQQNYLLKQQTFQQPQHQTQPNLQQIVLQQQNIYQQQDNNYRHLNQPNGLNPQQINFLQQNYSSSNLRDHIILQHKNHLFLNNFTNSYVGQNGEENLLLVDNLPPKNGFLENGIHLYNEYRNKENEGSKEEKGDLHQNRMSDDDLGFDPFHETQKALADLMEKELILQQRNQVKNNQYFDSQGLYSHQMDNTTQRNYSQQQHISLLNQQNQVGSKLLSQFQTQQILNSANQRLVNSGRVDSLRSTLPPPGFTSTTQSQHSYQHGVRNNKLLQPGLTLTNGDTSYQSHYLTNGVTKSGEWPEGLRSLLQDAGNSSPTTSASPSFTSVQKGWTTNMSNCTDWTQLDPAIVSSRPHNPGLTTQHQGYSQLHQNQFHNPMSQLHLGNLLEQQNSWLHRQNVTDDNLYYKGDWSTQIQNIGTYYNMGMTSTSNSMIEAIRK